MDGFCGGNGRQTPPVVARRFPVWQEWALETESNEKGRSKTSLTVVAVLKFEPK
jgi:hypothetical protein